MGDAVVLAAVRTPIGRAGTGSLVDQSIYELGKVVVGEVLKRSGVDPGDVDDLVLGEVVKGGGCTARYVAVDLGLPLDIPGVAVQRQCATGMTAVDFAAASIRAGMERVVVAGGVESMTQTPTVLARSPQRYGAPVPWLPPGHPETPDAPGVMGLLVGENTAEIADVSREDQDAWALESHRKALAAIDAGRFVDEIVPVNVAPASEPPRLFEVDEGPRRDTSAERLAALRPAFKAGGTVTAGNSSGRNDGACALVLADEDYAADRGLRPLAVIRSWAAVGVEPRRTGLAPIDALPKAAARAGVQVGDLALVELNEAFASMSVACTRGLDLDPAVVNVNGGAIALGHPIAASGARILTTLIHELRRRGGGLGAATMCAGGGMGAATVIEVLSPQ